VHAFCQATGPGGGIVTHAVMSLGSAVMAFRARECLFGNAPLLVTNRNDPHRNLDVLTRPEVRAFTCAHAKRAARNPEVPSMRPRRALEQAMIPGVPWGRWCSSRAYRPCVADSHLRTPLPVAACVLLVGACARA